MPEMFLAKIVNKVNIKEDIIKFSVKAPSITEKSEAGQFIEIRVSEGIDPFLRRPISIHNIKKEDGIIEFIIQLKGKGTKYLSEIQIGQDLDIIGPLGHGKFDSSKSEKLGIIGGGIGVFPLYQLAKQSIEKGKIVTTYLGFRNKDFVVLENEFKSVSTELVISTDDGSYGRNGFAINFLKQDIESGKVDSIFACGPMPMLKAVKKLAEEKNIPCQISIEENMACGLGLCLGCAVKTSASSNEAPEYVHVCKAGPVFDATYVDI